MDIVDVLILIKMSNKSHTSGAEVSQICQTNLFEEDQLVDLNKLFSEIRFHQSNVGSTPRKALPSKWTKGDKEKTSVQKRVTFKEDWHAPDDRDKKRIDRYFAEKRKKKRLKARRKLKPEIGIEIPDVIYRDPILFVILFIVCSFLSIFSFFRVCLYRERRDYVPQGALEMPKEKTFKNCAKFVFHFYYHFGKMFLFGFCGAIVAKDLNERYQDRVRGLGAREEYAITRSFHNIQRCLPANQRDKLAPALVAAITYIGTIANADSTSEVMRITIAVLGQYYSSFTMQDLRAFLHDFDILDDPNRPRAVAHIGYANGVHFVVRNEDGYDQEMEDRLDQERRERLERANARRHDISVIRENRRSQIVNQHFPEDMHERDEMHPEGDFSWKDTIKKLQDGTVALCDTPIGKFLVGVFTLISLSTASKGESPPSVARQMINRVLTDVVPYGSRMTLSDSIFSIFEFVATAIDCIKDGTSLSDFVYQDHFYEDICDTIVAGSHINGGELHKRGDAYVIDYKEHVAYLIKKIDRLTKKEGKRGRSTAMYMHYGIRLREIQEEMENYEVNLSFRAAPVGIVLVGPSAIGKSNLYPHIIGVVGAANGVEYKEYQIANLSPDAAYDDAVKQESTVIIMDDINTVNDKNAKNSEKAVCRIVNICNNSAHFSNQSAVENKGRIYFRPHLFIGSSNTADLGIFDTYKTPEAPLNRILIKEVQLLPEFQKDGKLDKRLAEMETAALGYPPVMHRVRTVEWKNVNVAKSALKTGGQQYAPVYGEWETFDVFLKKYSVEVRRHVAQQQALKESHLKMANTPKCKMCGAWTGTAWCTCDMQAELGELDDFSNDVQDMTISLYISLLSMDYFVWLVAVFERIGYWTLYYCSPMISFVVSQYTALSIGGQILTLQVCAILYLMFYFECLRFIHVMLVGFVCVTLAFSVCVALGRYFCHRVMREARSSIYEKIRSVPFREITAVTAAIVAARAIYKALVSSWSCFPQGNLQVTTPETVEQRRMEKSDWDKAYKRPVSFDHKAETSTLEQSISKIDKNMYKIKYQISEDAIKVGHCLFLEDNMGVMNKHVWRSFENTTPQVEFTRLLNGTVFKTYVQHFFEDPIEDLCYIIVASKPSTPSISHLIHPDRYSGLCQFIRRNNDGSILDEEVNVTIKDIQSGAYASILPKTGLVYQPKTPTKHGDCGSVLITANKPHSIVGIHCAGNGRHGASTILSQVSLQRFREWLNNIDLTPEGEFLIPICGFGDSIDMEPYDEKGVVVTQDIDPRHAVNFYDCHDMCVSVCGYSEESRLHGRSDVRYNSAAPILKELGVDLVYGPPRPNANRDHAAALQDRSTPMRDIRPELLRRAVADYVGPLLDIAKEKGFRFFRKPLSLYESLNGCWDTRFINPIDETKSCGYGKKGPKKNLVEITYDDISGAKIIQPSPELEGRFSLLMKRAKTGNRLNPLIKTALKSEPVKYENDGTLAKNTRIFFVVPFADFLITKALFAPIVDFLLSFPLVSECMGGVNVNRDDWGSIYQHLKEFGVENCIESDFKRWDIRLSGQIIRSGGSSLVMIAKAIGYDDESILAMTAILSDLANSYVMFQGALITVDGWMISGTYLTLLLNSVCNSLIHRCAFFDCYYEGTYVTNYELKYRDHVRSIFMGDDALATSRTDEFNQLVMWDFCRRHNIEYTSGSKSDVMEPFCHLDTATFCKRTFYYNPILQQYLAPLAIPSIMKSLYMYKSESCVIEKQQIVDAFGASLFELARHPREVFEHYHEILVKASEIMEISNLVLRLEMSYDEWMVLLDNRYFSDGSSLGSEEIYEDVFEPEGAECAGVIAEAIPKPKLVTDRFFPKGMVRLFWLGLGILVLLYNPPSRMTQIKRISIFQVSKTPNSQIGNLSVNSQTSAWEAGVQTSSDGSELHASTSDTNDSFFKRPVRVDNFTWEVGQSLYAEFNPWRSFYEDPRIMNRIAHFRNLRSKLHVELLVNGNPFYYGRGIMSYIPMPDSDQISIFRSDVPQDLVEASQRPHIYFNPTTCEGGTLSLPFVFPKTHINITEREWRKMGLITLKSMNSLRHANGGTDPITITVLVYASEIELNTPTSITPFNLVPQGGTEYGMISGPATTVARIAGIMSQVPMISNFARATEMIASAGAKAAMIFGYSRPRIQIQSAEYVIPHSSLANVNEGDSSASIALDTKKEITIDPAVCGLGSQDDMAFCNIATRESFIDSFEWSELDPPDRHLYSMRINPLNGLLDGSGHAHITPAGLVALPFDFWTGSMEVRLQVVSSAYHRGRIRIVWDPSYVKDPNVFNVSYSALIDITESTEVTFKIGWGQDLDYLRVPLLRDHLLNIPRASAVGDVDPFSNGTLSVYVVNGLTSPADDSTLVEINVFTRMCEDMQVASPTSYNFEKMRLVRNPFRIPEDLDVVFGLEDARKMISSRGTEPTRTDEAEAEPETFRWVQLLPDGPRYFKYSTYSNSNTVQTTRFIMRNGSLATATVTFGWGDSEQTVVCPPGLPDTTFTFNLNVKPGWNNIDFRYTSNSTDLDMVRVDTGVPVGNTAVILRGSELAAKVTAPVVDTFEDYPDTEFVTTTNANSTVLFLNDAVAGTIATVAMTRPSIVEGSTQTLADLNLPPNASRMFSFVVPSDLKITISKSPVQTPWVMELTSVSYIRDDAFVPEGGEENTTMEMGGSPPEALAPLETMGSTIQPPNMNDIYFGENIGSFRTLLKRYTTCYFWDLPDGTTPASFPFTVLPHYPTTVISVSGTGNVYTSTPNIFHFVASAFVCMRGSTRMTLIENKTYGADQSSWFFSRVPQFRRTEYKWYQVYESGPSFTQARYKTARVDGSAVESRKIKPLVQLEMPYYSNLKFTSPRTGSDYRPQDYIVESQYLAEPMMPSVNAWLSVNYAAGEDFSLAFFLSTPELEFV